MSWQEDIINALAESGRSMTVSELTDAIRPSKIVEKRRMANSCIAKALRKLEKYDLVEIQGYSPNPPYPRMWGLCKSKEV